ncbi:murein hydrolase activator EnvC family protein [Terrihabitans sp. B22-R8]|uniref:murein hydrolase activator EnvC family protein n=1 Tax=Terrihabitans sp. B22-R8 TaxID=3425128 RepID=UPI00403CB9BB
MQTIRHIGHGLAAGVLALLIAACPLAVSAQPRDPETKRQELEARRAELDRARQNEERIRAELGDIAQERERLAEELVTTAARIRSTEGEITGAEQRLTDLSASERDVQVKLAESRAVVAELLAALQRMGRRPPPAIIVQPKDALTSVRTAMLLGNLLPEIRGQTQVLAQDLAELERVRGEIAGQRDTLATAHADLQASQQRIGILIEARQKRQSEQETALVDERQNTQKLSRDVRSLEELIARMEREIASSRKAAEAAARQRPGELDAPPSRSELAALNDPGRIAPAFSFASAKGLLPLPVNGLTLTRFGEEDAYGSTQKGISISTRSRAQVTAPCDGWVVYAGPFRSYGQVLILNAGGGYHVLLAGMQTVNVTLGQFVLTGEPVAEMGEGANQTASMIGGGAAQPVLYVEFRKDGQSINPGPWWANSSAEKVRG